MEHHGAVLLSPDADCIDLPLKCPFFVLSQVDMTKPGIKIDPAASPKEKKLLEAKYKIFREAIDIQRRWRKDMAEAASNQ